MGSDTFKCPYLQCVYGLTYDKDTIRVYLVFNGVIRDKKLWELCSDILAHSTPSNINRTSGDCTKDDGIHKMVLNALKAAIDNDKNFEYGDTGLGDGDKYLNGLKKLLEDSYKSLFEGCKSFKKLSFVLHLFNI